MRGLEKITRLVPSYLHAGIVSVAMAAFSTGCGTAASSGTTAAPAGSPPAVNRAAISPTDPRAPILMEGFEVGLAFPGASNLNTTLRVRPDGKITAPLIGEVEVLGMTPVQLEAVLKEKYATQLVSNELTVTLVSSAFPVNVNGAVTRTGEIICDRPTTAFEVVMKAGLIMESADLKNVFVTRRENGRSRRIELNLQLVLDGKDDGLFFLKPGDSVFVPRRVI